MKSDQFISISLFCNSQQTKIPPPLNYFINHKGHRDRREEETIFLAVWLYMFCYSTKMITDDLNLLTLKSIIWDLCVWQIFLDWFVLWKRFEIRHY